MLSLACQVKNRIYLDGVEFREEIELRKIGGRCDRRSNRWWVPSDRVESLQCLISDLKSNPHDGVVDTVVLYARVSYYGRSLYVREWSKDRSRARLIDLSGLIDIWVLMDGRKSRVVLNFRDDGRGRFPTVLDIRSRRRPDAQKTCWQCGDCYKKAQCSEGEWDDDDDACYCGC